MADLAAIEAHLLELRDGLQHLAHDDWLEGRWLLPLMAWTLDDYPSETSLPLLQHAHPDAVTPSALAEARVTRAQWVAAAGGGVSAGAYASVVMGSLVTGTWVGTALPAAALAWGVDMAFLARVQLCLAWDLSLIHGRNLDPASDEDLWLLARVAFGVDPESHWSHGTRATVPLASRFGTRALTTSARLASGVTAIGRTLALRSLSKLAIPALGVPLCAGVNHWTTGTVGRQAERLFRQDAAEERLQDAWESGTALVFSTVLALVEADGTVTPEEAATVLLPERPPPRMAAKRLLQTLSQQPPPARLAVLDAARAAADLDGFRGPEERRLLEAIAALCRTA